MSKLPVRAGIINYNHNHTHTHTYLTSTLMLFHRPLLLFRPQHFYCELQLQYIILEVVCLTCQLWKKLPSNVNNGSLKRFGQMTLICTSGYTKVRRKGRRRDRKRRIKQIIVKVCTWLHSKLWWNKTFHIKSPLLSVWSIGIDLIQKCNNLNKWCILCISSSKQGENRSRHLHTVQKEKP